MKFNLKILNIYFFRLIILIAICEEIYLFSDEKLNEKDIIRSLVSLEYVTSGNSFKDLQPLKSYLQHAQVIAFGEATHGTREFFQCKHRMLEFLVREMGCRYLMIEASYANCLKINEYVLHGKGDCKTVLSEQGFWCWNTEEVTEMLNWMRSYNQTAAKKDQVQFLGFDCQFSEKAGEVLCGLIEKGTPEYKEKAVAILEPLKKSQALMRAEEPQLKQFKNKFQEVHEFLISSKNEWQCSREDHQHALFLVRLLQQECDLCLIEKDPYFSVKQYIITQNPHLRNMLEEQGPEAFFTDEIISQFPELEKCIHIFLEEQSLRDTYMAENIITLLDSVLQDERVMIWAHNGHIAFGECDGISPMGSLLRQKLGSHYYSIGFTTSCGTFQALEANDNKMALKIFDIPPQPKDSWAYFCGQLGQGKNFFLDFRSTAQNQWLRTPHFFLSLGNCFSTQWTPESFLANLIPIEQFDGLIHLHQTSAACPN